MDETNKAKTLRDNRTRAQKARDLHKLRSEERAAAAQTLKAAYLQDRDSTTVQDILTKARAFVAYHNKIAQDGVGSRKTGDHYENGTDVMEVYYLTAHERVSHLDKSAGIQELIDYIERQIELPAKTAQQEVEGDAPEPTEEETPAE